LVSYNSKSFSRELSVNDGRLSNSSDTKMKNRKMTVNEMREKLKSKVKSKIPTI
jgi:hypothetical protein